LSLDSDWELIARESDKRPEKLATPADLVYAIFTSGSTGRPKCASVFQSGFVNLVNWFTTEFGIGAGDRVLLMSSLSFDLTQKNVFAPLLTGGRLHLLDSDFYEPGVILDRIEAAGITLLNCTPSAFYPLVELAARDSFTQLESLRSVFLGGEPISVSRLRPWVESGRCRAEIVNTYGPTECTDISSFHRLDDFTAASAPIGRPICNTRSLIVDRDLNLLPVGIVGELVIAGDGVGGGYLNDPPLTSSRFLPDPFSDRRGSRLYRTGDLAKYLPSGAIEFVGRVDHQVKVRGFRIELGEIESVLAGHPDVREAVAVVRSVTHGCDDRRIIAYVVPAAGHQPNRAELRSLLQDQLPQHMVPSAIVVIEALPLTPSGKVDRLSLPAPESAGEPTDSSYVAPRSRLEQTLSQIWQEVLNAGRVGIHDNFFDLGGHSLLIVQVQARLSATLGREVAAVDLFRYPNISSLAKFLSDDGSAAVTISAIRGRAEQQRAALRRASVSREDARPVESQRRRQLSG
jgi:amino acid adenylation domain-containing protein